MASSPPPIPRSVEEFGARYASLVSLHKSARLLDLLELLRMGGTKYAVPKSYEQSELAHYPATFATQPNMREMSLDPGVTL